MSFQARHQDSATADGATSTPLGEPAQLRPMPDVHTPGQPVVDLDFVAASLRELEHSLANERSLQLELAQTLLATIRTLLDEQAELQREVAELKRRAVGWADERLDTSAGGHGALREQAHQAHHHSAGLAERSRQLCGRASELMVESRRLTLDARSAGHVTPRKRSLGT